MTSLTMMTLIMAAVTSMMLLNSGCYVEAASTASTVESQYFGSRRAGQPPSVTETQQEGQAQDQDQLQVRSRIQQDQNFLAFVQQQGLVRQQLQQPISPPAYPFHDATPRSGPELQLAQLQYQQQILQQQQKLLQLQLQQQRLQQQGDDRPTAHLSQPDQYQQQQQQQQRSPTALLGVAFSPATSVAHTRFSGNGINYNYR